MFLTLFAKINSRENFRIYSMPTVYVRAVKARPRLWFVCKAAKNWQQAEIHESLTFVAIIALLMAQLVGYLER